MFQFLMQLYVLPEFKTLEKCDMLYFYYYDITSVYRKP